MTPELLEQIRGSLTTLVNGLDEGQPWQDLLNYLNTHTRHVLNQWTAAEGPLEVRDIEKEKDQELDDIEAREVAKEVWAHGSSDELEIDDDAVVSRGDEEEGFFVAAWVWVRVEQVERYRAEQGDTKKPPVGEPVA